MNTPELPLIDLIVLAVLSIAIGRGVWLGLIREGLSLVAIGAATIVTRLAVVPAAAKLSMLTGGEISGRTALWIAGVLLVVATILAAGMIARILRRGAVFAGLGWADRVGGGALGAAEGAGVSAILVFLARWLVGNDHPATEDSRSVAFVEELRSMRERGELPNVASPGNWH